MPKRKNKDQKYEVLRKKLKEIEKELQRDRRPSRPSRLRVLSSSSSSSNGSSRLLSELQDSTPRAVHNEPDLDHIILEHNAPQEAPISIPVADTNHNAEILQDTTPELDADILQILGVDPTKMIKYGKNIQKDVALRFEHIATTGLSKDERKELTDKYHIPENCKLIGAPALNPEIKVALSETVTKRDKVIQSKQTLLASAISSLGEAITLVLSSKERNTELLRSLMDTGRTLCDCQHNDTLTRRNFIIYSVKKDMKEPLQAAKIDDFLFGQSLPDTLKVAKAINKSGADLKPSTVPKPSTGKQNIPSKNWKGSYHNTKRKQPAQTKDATMSITTRSQRANSSKQSQNQRPVRTVSHNRR